MMRYRGCNVLRLLSVLFPCNLDSGTSLSRIPPDGLSLISHSGAPLEEQYFCIATWSADTVDPMNMRLLLYE
jgi:hypothetical protein